MIEDENQLEYSVECLTKMYAQRVREKQGTEWHSSTRDAIVQSTTNMINKIEREVAEYLARKYDYLSDAESVREAAENTAAQEKAA